MARKRAFYDGDVAILRDGAKGVEYELGRLKRLIARAARAATVGESAEVLPVIADSAQKMFVQVQRLVARSYTIASPTRALPPSGVGPGGKRRHAPAKRKTSKAKPAKRRTARKSPSRLSALVANINALTR